MTTIVSQVYRSDKPEEVKTLLQNIDANLHLTDFSVDGFNTIITDILNEDLTFATWPALGKEIRIREVGYQVEAAMRKLLAQHRPRYTECKQKFEDYKKKANEIWDEEAKKAPDQRQKYVDSQALVRDIDAYEQTVYKGIITWGNPSYVDVYADKNIARQMFQWIAGLRNDDPEAFG